MKRTIVSLFAICAVVFASKASAQSIYVANLDPNNERPTPFPDSTMGGLAVASVTFNDDGTSTALIIVSAFGSSTPITASHVHRGDSETAGPITCGLTGADFVNPVIRTCNFDAADTDRLVNGNLYVNVHTQMLGGGEIRDQLTFVQ